MDVYHGRRILIMGGASVHLKLIQAAKELGAYTIVTDHLSYEESPGKQIADDYWNYNIYDLSNIIKRIHEENVEAVVSGWLDPCQKPYQMLCRELGFHCYGTADQFFRMTDKHAFKKMCQQNGVDVIPEYSEEDVQKGRAEYPLFIKPVDSRGSRGQTVCYNREEAAAAIAFAKSESSNGDIIIERYLKHANEVQITYFFINGEAYLIRTTDSFNGREEVHLEKVVACSISPSRYTGEYLATAHSKVIKMFQNMGFRNGPIFMQGFYDDGVFRFFDPGLRFPGVDYDRLYPEEYGVDLADMMVHFAFDGEMPVGRLPSDMYQLHGKRAAVLFPVIKAGVITQVHGVEDAIARREVFSFLQRHAVGESVEWTHNVNQRFAEIDLLAANTEALKACIASLQKEISVMDQAGNEMLFEPFDVNRVI